MELPLPAENDPGAQEVHAPAPGKLNVPAVHAGQKKPLARVPAGQGVQAAAPELLIVPIGQLMQLVEPGGAKVPAPHGKQKAVPGDEAAVPPRHGMHEVAAPPPVKVPAGHVLHAAAPVKGLAVPAVHGMQKVCPVDG